MLVDPREAASRVRSRGMVLVVFPVLGVTVEMLPFSSRSMLDTGTLPLINMNPSEDEISEADMEERADNFLQDVRETLVGRSYNPKIVFGPTTKEDEISVEMLTDPDLTAGWYQLFQTSARLFYGVNHQAFELRAHMRLADKQHSSAVLMDMLCKRYSKAPWELTPRYGVREEDLREAFVVMQAGLDAEAPPEKPEGDPSGVGGENV